MTFEKRNIGFLVAFIIIGAILGSAIGSFFSGVIPALSVLNKNLTGPIGFNIEVVSFHIKLTLSAIIGILAALVIYIKV